MKPPALTEPRPGKVVSISLRMEGIGTGRWAWIRFPSQSCAAQIGALVNGLLRKQMPTEKGTLPLHFMVTSAAAMDWAGMGITAKNAPMAAPAATESRQGTHNLRS